MPEQKYNRDTQRLDCLGLDLNRPLDSIKPGKFPYLQNVRSYQQGRIEPREGLQAIDSSLDSASTHSIRRLNDPSAASFARIIGTGTLLGFGQTHFTAADNGYSGDPLALVPYRPDQSPQSWMYVADRLRMRKIDRTGKLHQIGLPWPMTPPVLATSAARLVDISVPQYKIIDDFDVVAGPLYTQAPPVGGSPSLLSAGPGYRTTSTISQILYDNGTTGWASVALTSMAGIGAGEDLTFNPVANPNTENAIVESVHSTAANVTIGSIIYDSGSTGFCSIALTGVGGASGFGQQVNVEDLMRNITIGENIRVLAVTLGMDDNISIRAFTVSTFAAGNTLQTLASFRVYLANNHVVGETVRTDGVRVAIVATGVTTVTRTIALDLALLATGLPSHADDYMHISVRLDNPTLVTEMSLLLDVDSTLNDFAHNYYKHTFSPADFTNAIPNSLTPGAASQVTIQLTSGQIVTGYLAGDVTLAAAPDGTSVFSSSGAFLGLFQRTITVSGVVKNNQILSSGSIVGTITQPADYGTSQWTELKFRLSELLRVGTDDTRTLANVAAIRISITVTGAVNLDLDSWWIGGGYGPDSGPDNVPYLYRYRARVPATGARSNWSPALRGGLTPKRQAITVRLAQYPVPPGTTMVTSDIVLDVQRYGGSITAWHYVGTANNDAVPFITDIYPDSTVAVLPSEGQEFWQPWPVIGLPVTGPASGTSTASGTTLNDGDTGFNLFWAPGTQIFVNGIPFTIYRVISTSRLETVENMGSITTVTWKVPEPTILAQPLPCLWGDDQVGVMFACGDTTNPGRLYYSNPNDPDTTTDSNYLDITNPSEMLQNGVIYNGRAYQFSSERYFELLPDGQGGWRAIEVPGCRGLYARWAITRNPTPIVCFLAKDGIYAMEGGSAKSLTDADLYPLLPNEGNPGVTTNHVLTPIMTTESSLRLEVYDDYLYFDYNPSLEIIIASVSAGTPTCPLTGAVAGTPYTATLTSTGSPPLTFILLSGALPTGLSLSAGGIISGTPVVTGTFSFTIQVTDSSGSTGTLSCSIVVTGVSTCQMSDSLTVINPNESNGIPDNFTQGNKPPGPAITSPVDAAVASITATSKPADLGNCLTWGPAGVVNPATDYRGFMVPIDIYACCLGMTQFIQCTSLFTANASPNGTIQAGLAVQFYGSTEKWNGYVFIITSDDRSWLLLKINNGVESTLASGGAGTTADGDVFRMISVVSATQVVVTINKNGVLFTTVTDSTGTRLNYGSPALIAIATNGSGSPKNEWRTLTAGVGV